MDPYVLQNVRYKLQKRVGRLNSIDDSHSFIFSLIQFWNYLERQPVFRGIIEELLNLHPDAKSNADSIFTGQAMYGETEEEAAAIGYEVLRKLLTHPKGVTQIGITYHKIRKESNESLDAVKELFLEPIYEYIDEQLDDQRLMLALILKYKQRSEWFNQKLLQNLSNEGHNAERMLSIDLYSYLYDQGLDFLIEPSSITGEIDLISTQPNFDT